MRGPIIFPRFKWTPELEARARSRWRKGHRVADIAAEIGTTKNAVIGKANRKHWKRNDICCDSMIDPKIWRRMADHALRARAVRLAKTRKKQPWQCSTPSCRNTRVTLTLCSQCDQKRLRKIERERAHVFVGASGRMSSLGSL